MKTPKPECCTESEWTEIQSSAAHAMSTLPWHMEAAKAITAEPLPTMSQFINVRDCILSRQTAMAERIAAHDPHAAQHQETVRLLEGIIQSVEQLHDSPKSLLFNLKIALPSIRAHLAALKQPAAPAQNADLR